MRRLWMIPVIIMMMGASQPVQARPVTYPGGWMLMQMNDSNMHALMAHYSPTARYSVGYRGEYWRDEEWQLHTAQIDWLAKRWNLPASQANFWLKGAAGVAYSDSGAFHGKTEPAGVVGMEIDWEDRRFFTLYENRYTEAGDIDRFFMQKARVGVAPYIGDYGDLHTWLMLEVEHNPEDDDSYTVTPLVRLFQDSYLFEAGMSLRGDLLFNAMIQF